MDPGRDRHWQDAWGRAGLATGQRIPGRRKFYALIAYPGTSGFLHLGHLRSFAYVDALHRYHRMLGESVLFPFGVHASGLPAVTWAQKVTDHDPSLAQQLDDRNVSEEERRRLEDPESAARFLGETYRQEIRSLGVLVDPTTYLTTVDPDYQAFVHWQFRALMAAGALIKGSYFASVCPVCGPVAVDPSETDLSSGGNAEVVKFTTVPFRLDDGRVLLAATLRPETVYGVTNLWLPASGSLVVWHHGDHSYLVARTGAERLVEQHGGHIGHEVPVEELVGRSVHVPARDVLVPVLRSSIVDPKVGTGVVMSVPAHAPVDAAALAEVDAETRGRIGPPPVLVEVPSDAPLSVSERGLVTGDGTPAERALRSSGVRGLSDAGPLRDATEKLYRLEYVRGRMTVPQLEGVLVREARERVIRDLAASGGSLELQEFSEPVICRNGHEVIIRRISNQWYLHYADPEWKATTLKASAALTNWPEDFAREFPDILAWFGDRPCARKGRWLGTPFPFDPEWIIEPIADSTLYMAYYLVRRYVSTGRVQLGQLTDAFFDFVIRGAGPGEPGVDRSLLEEIRAEFLYWYPLDINMGGKEHKRVHFPAFLYTHVRLLPTELQPRGIYVNGWITGFAGGKISKKEVSSKGGRIPPIPVALARWGADALRLFYVVVASPALDTEWDSEIVEDARNRLVDIERLVREARGDSSGPPELDAWLRDAFHRQVRDIRAAYDATDLRRAAELTYVGIPATLRRYYLRGGTPSQATDQLRDAWIRLLAPITPHLAEELADGDGKGLVAVRAFPTIEEFPRSEVAEARERFVDQVEQDLRAVLRPLADRKDEMPDEVVFYVAEPWKAHVETWMRESVARGETPTVREIMDRAIAHPEVSAHRAEVAKYLQRVLPQLRTESAPGPGVDEMSVLRTNEGYLVRRLGFRTVQVVRESEAESLDPLGRRERARPGRPAFYLVRRGVAPEVLERAE
jgi:leucyl-tRNA synthetase